MDKITCCVRWGIPGTDRTPMTSLSGGERDYFTRRFFASAHDGDGIHRHNVGLYSSSSAHAQSSIAHLLAYLK